MRRSDTFRGTVPATRTCPVYYAQRQRETFPNAEIVILDDSGHWPMIDHPVAVEQPVLRFLSALLT